MESEDRRFIFVIVAVAILIVSGYGALAAHTGFSTPFSMVMSESMQHDDTRSQIGIIDTGDAVITGNKDKFEIKSYVDGSKDGYSTFGDYGNVIIYKHWSNTNPVIHRAIVYLEYDPATDVWSAPSLEGYEGSWSCSKSGQDYNNLRGELVFHDITKSHKNVKFNLDTFDRKESGYLTMGDNPVTNNSFDQSPASGSGSYLVSMDKIESIALYEIPWIGTLKILLKKDGENLDKVPNSLPSLTMAIIGLVSVFLLIDIFAMRKDDVEIDKELKKMRRY